MHQHTTLYYHICLLEVSMVSQWYLVCISLTITCYCISQHQDISLQCVRIKLPTACLGYLTLKYTIAAQNKYEKCLRRFRKVWSYLRKYKKCDVRLVFLIQLLYILVFNQEHFLCNLPCIILLFIDEDYYMVIPSYLLILPYVMVIYVIFPYSTSIIQRKLETIS